MNFEPNSFIRNIRKRRLFSSTASTHQAGHPVSKASRARDPATVWSGVVAVAAVAVTRHGQRFGPRRVTGGRSVGYPFCGMRRARLWFPHDVTARSSDDTRRGSRTTSSRVPDGYRCAACPAFAYRLPALRSALSGGAAARTSSAVDSAQPPAAWCPLRATATVVMYVLEHLPGIWPGACA